MITRVLLISPFRADNPTLRGNNRKYLRRAIRDSIINHGEAPFASHEMYTRALDDNEPREREIGVNLLLAWFHHAEKMVVYADLGISRGMELEIAHAVLNKIPIEYRYIKGKAGVRQDAD